MRPYLAVLSARFQTLLQYRAAAFAGMATQVFWGLLRIAILTAFYQSTQSNVPPPMSLLTVISYVWLGQSLFRLLPTAGDPEIRQMFLQGNVAYELVRPIDLYRLWYARSIANQTAPVFLRAAPMFLVAWLFFGLSLPASLTSGLAFSISICCTVFLSAAIVNLYNLSLIWTISGEGITRLTTVAVWGLSGVSVPLPLFPDWMQSVLSFLPFSGLLDKPIRLYTGHIPASELWMVLLHQLSWTLALVLLGQFLCRRGMKRLVIQGG